MLYFPGQEKVSLRTGPFRVTLSTNVPGLVDQMAWFYGDDLDASPSPGFSDIHIKVLRILPTRRWKIGRIVLVTDTPNPYATFPVSHHFPFFEWGLNWCVAMQSHQFLMLHAAVLERDGKALLLPAMPGSGKSTLCAALAYRGWRLLSDEFGLYRPETGLLIPMPRPLPLKNESIDIIRAFAPEAPMGPVYPATHKGDVAHLKPPADSIRRQAEPAVPRWIVFPQFVRGGATHLYPYAAGLAFLKLAGNAFNYRLLGEHGFRGVTRMIRTCETRYLEFGDLGEAIDVLEEFASTTP